MRDQYTTIAAPARAEIKVLGSRFIASAHPLGKREEVKEVLDSVRREFFDATHHCFAYRLGPEGTDFRAVDGGEPSGTAGKPILAAIDRGGFTDILLVVTRYFGGTKLGTGGLARAYGDAASGVLSSATARICYVMITLRASCSHAMMGPVMHAIGKVGAKIEGTEYDEEVHLALRVRASRVDELEAALVEATRGGIRMRREGSGAGGVSE
jgi:uncharacterized YigZ family protein